MHRFNIDAILDPQSLPRVANFFAQRALLPERMTAQALSAHMRIEVIVPGLDAPQAAIIAAKLGETVAVLRSGVETARAVARAMERTG